MAEIRSFRKERTNQTNSSTENYQDRIKRHRRVGLYRVLLVVACVLILVFVVIFKYMTHIYTDYEITNTVPVEMVRNAAAIPLGDHLMTYSADGAHCTDAKGEVVWNQTFEMQNIMISQNGTTVAIGDYNGREIYVMNAKGKIGEIHTTMPIRSFSVAETGRVAVSVTDSKITWIYIYEADGTMKYEVKTTMGQSGYPVAFSLSPNGELMGLSCIYVDSGVVKSRVAFYNFGDVGENKSDYYVSGQTFPDTIIPMIRFMGDDRAYAVGDDRLVVFAGNQVPTLTDTYLFADEVQGVYNDSNYVALVFGSDRLEYQHKITIYTKSPDRMKDYYVDMDFTNMIFEDSLFTIYNNKECQVYTYGGKEKYRGEFDSYIRLLIPQGGSGSYKYLALTDQSLDTIQLK